MILTTSTMLALKPIIGASCRLINSSIEISSHIYNLRNFHISQRYMSTRGGDGIKGTKWNSENISPGFATTQGVSNITRSSNNYPLNPDVVDLPDLDLPLKPKKPITPWIAFLRERTDEVRSQKARDNEKMRIAELWQILAKEWKSIDKSKYEAEYNANRERYLIQKDNYESSLTLEHLDYMNKKKDLAKQKKALHELKKTKPPTRPRGPINFYTSEKSLDPHIKEQLKAGSAGRVLANLTKEYKLLSDQEKEKYIEMRERDKIRFCQEFKQWFENITNKESGHSGAVRKLAQKMRVRLESRGYVFD